MKRYNNILLSADAQEGTEIDPLSQAASGVEAPKFPLLAPDRICRFNIKSCKKDAVKDKPGRELLTITLRTERDYVDTDGRPLRAGFSGFKRIGITPTDGDDNKRPRTNKEIAADLALILRAVGMGDKTARDLINNPSMIEGQVIDCKVGIAKGNNGYPDSNTFTPVPPA